MLQDDYSEETELAAVVWYPMQTMAALQLQVTAQQAGGSRPGRSSNVSRDVRVAHWRLMLDNFWPAADLRPDRSVQEGRVYYPEQ